MRQEKLTLWKIEVVVLAAIFCAVTRAKGLLLIYISIPLWSVAVWLMLTERQSMILRDTAASLLGFLFLAWLAQYAFGVRLPALLNRLRPAMLQYVVIGMGGGFWIATRIKAKCLGAASDTESIGPDIGNPPPS